MMAEDFRVSCGLIAVVIVSATLTEGAENTHAKQFAALCKVLRLAEASPVPPQVITDQAKNKALAEIYNLSNKTDDIASRIGGKIGEVIHVKAHRALARASKINEQLEKSLSDAEESARLAKVHLRKAIYDADYTDETGEAVKPSKLTGPNIFVKHDDNTNGASCGGASGGLHDAGKTLINDFYCICMGKNSGLALICGNGLTQTSSAWTQSGSNQAFSLVEWNKIADRCPKGSGPVSESRISEALAAFHAQLGTSAVGSDSALVGPTVLGTLSTAGTGCDGSNANQACVIYKKVLESGGIPWENQMKDAQREIQKMNARARDSHNWLEKLQDVEHLLHDLYNESLIEAESEKISSETKNKNSPAEGNTADGLSSSRRQEQKELAATLSRTASPRFLLPWTLLM